MNSLITLVCSMYKVQSSMSTRYLPCNLLELKFVFYFVFSGHKACGLWGEPDALQNLLPECVKEQFCTCLFTSQVWPLKKKHWGMSSKIFFFFLCFCTLFFEFDHFTFVIPKYKNTRYLLKRLCCHWIDIYGSHKIINGFCSTLVFALFKVFFAKLFKKQFRWRYTNTNRHLLEVINTHTHTVGY